MSSRTDHPLDPPRYGNRNTVVVACVLLGLMALTLFLRAWQLNTIPPGLFGDEAQSGLDVQAWLRGESGNLFPHHLGGETLYGYLSVPFVALWNGLPLGIRFVSALMGMLMIPALFLAARALWREQPRLGAWVGLMAAALWMVNYWPQSVNRIGFQVNTLPFVLTLAVIAWLAWTHKPSRRRAATFGVLAALVLMTYPAARITPFLWPLLYLTLERGARKALRPTLGYAAAAFAVAVLPLAVHFALTPYDLTYRANAFATLGGAAPLTARLQLWLVNIGQVVAVYFGGPGDPSPRHNLPGRPAFAPYLAVLLVAGVVLAVSALRRRDRAACTLLLWWAVLSLPAIAAADANPHYLRLLGALPAALLLMAWPLARLLEWSRAKSRYLAAAVAGLLVVLLAVEAARTARDYFVAWAHDTDLYYDYQEDVWTVGQRIAATPGAIGVVPVDPTMPHDFVEHSLAYGFPDTPILQKQVKEAEIERWLQENLGKPGGSTVMTPAWHEGPEFGADAKGLLQFYLGREGALKSKEAFRGNDLLTYALDRAPQFEATGRLASPDQSFSSTIKLTGARWGAAKPNPDSNGDAVAAGTPAWAILTWELERPSPDLAVTLDVVDEDGHRLASAETPLLNADRKPVSQWQVGDTAQSYHLVPVPATQLPGQIRIESRAYDAASLQPLLPEHGTPRLSVQIGVASVTPALTEQPPGTLDIARPIQTSLSTGVTLLGADAWPDELGPGQMLTLRLLWQVDEPLTAARSYTISLAGTSVSDTVNLPAATPPGHAVHTYADLDLPPDLPTGAYDLVLASRGGGETFVLGKMAVAGRTRAFEAPQVAAPVGAQFGDLVALVGTDAPAELRAAPGQPLALDLFWQVLATSKDELVRFVHLMGTDGRPLAQQDVVPCEGACPASSWLPREYLTDKAEVVLPPDIPPGTYSMGVGWAKPAAAWQRLPVSDANGERQANDLFVLPLKVVVQP